MTIKDFPISGPYYVSVLGTTINNEEIFSYKQIIIENKNEKNNKADTEDNRMKPIFYIIIIILSIIGIIIIIVFTYKFIKLKKQKLDLSEQVKRISMTLSREDEDKKRDSSEQKENLIN